MTERSRPRQARAAPRTEQASVAPRGPYRIHVVAELTDVPEPTLRAWERRYGIPTPERTPSGYRLYSESDVEQVREMRRLCDAGMPASAVAKLLLAGKEPRESSPPRTHLSEPYAETVEGLLDAVSRFDEAALDRQLRQLMFLGSATTILDRVVVPALHEIGERWHDGALSVAQEHLASHRFGTVLRDLMRLADNPESGSRVLLACFADDEHELGLLGAAMRFSGWGLRPVFLGARTPPGALHTAVEAVKPALVALSVTVTPTRARARELVDDYASACGGVPWLVGGAGVAGMAEMIGARGGQVAPSDPEALRSVVRAAVQRAAGPRPADPRSGRRRS